MTAMLPLAPATASRPVPVLHPPPELAPALAALVSDPGDELALAAACDMREECGMATHSASDFLPVRKAGFAGRVEWHRLSIVAVSCTLAEWLEHGPQLAKWHPLLRVALTDREPCDNGGSVAWQSSKYDPKTEAGPLSRLSWFLPWGIFQSFAEPWTEGSSMCATRRFAERGEALAALSRAAILWARSQPVR
jgi:hypothetical protein